MEELLTAGSLITSIPEERLDFFSQEFNIDWNVKKLSGKELFKLCLFGVLAHDRPSSRVFSSFYQSAFFCKYAGIEEGKRVSHSSIAERIGKISPEYFKGLYQYCVGRFSDALIPTSSIGRLCRYDSTISSLSCKLLHFGMHSGAKNKLGEHQRNGIKFTVGFDGLPSQMEFHKDQAFISEDLALGQALESHSKGKEHIAIFDRGLQKRATFETLSENGRFFVTRINPSSRTKLADGHEPVILNSQTDTLVLSKHSRVHLFGRDKKRTKHSFRLIEGMLRERNEPICFLTNLPEEDFTPEEIAHIYRSRWEIEAFFRFIKQELSFSHFFSTTWKGIQNMAYIIMIASILLLAFKKNNQMKGYKIPKMLFINQLEKEILSQIVKHCGGNPELIEQMSKADLFGSS